jgi:hypothetical protein
MTRYLKQWDYISCGPVAIINAMKWRGMKVSRRSHFKKLKRKCKCNHRDGGTYKHDLTRALRNYLSNVKCKVQESINTLDRHLDSGGAVIIAYDYIRNDDVREGHYVFCIGKTKHYYTLVNDVCTKNGELLPNTISKKSRKNMVKMLRLENEMWLI